MLLVRIVQRTGGHLGVVLADTTHAGGGQQVVPLFHLPFAAFQHARRLCEVCSDGLIGILRHGDEVIEQAYICVEFDLFRVDHHELEIVRMAGVEQTRDERIDAHRLARARGARNEHVRHVGEILQKHLTFDGFAEGYREIHAPALLVAGIAEPGRGEHRAESDHLARAVRDLHANRTLAGNGSDNADARCGEGHRKVVL